MDGLQKILLAVVVLLTVLLVIVGVEVIFIFADIRRALKRINSILDDAILGGGLIRPEKLRGILELFKMRKNKKREVEEENF